jgi:hypothetical protein
MKVRDNFGYLGEYERIILKCFKPRSDAVGYQRFTLKMKAARSSETVVCCHKTTRLHNPEELHMNFLSRKNFQYRNIKVDRKEVKE